MEGKHFGGKSFQTLEREAETSRIGQRGAERTNYQNFEARYHFFLYLVKKKRKKISLQISESHSFHLVGSLNKTKENEKCSCSQWNMEMILKVLMRMRNDDDE